MNAIIESIHDDSFSVSLAQTRQRPIGLVPVNGKTSYPTPLMSPNESIGTIY